MKLEIQIAYPISLDTVREMVQVLDSVRKPSEPHAHTVIKLQDIDSPVSGHMPAYCTLTRDEYQDIVLPRSVPLVTPENCEYIKHIRISIDSNKKQMSWCGKEIHGEAYFVSIDHAACTGGSKSRLMSCLDCNNAIISALDNGWDEDHQPDEEEEEGEE